LPEIRSKLNLLLSSKRPSELATVAGKKKLAIEIATEANSVLGIHNAPEPVAAPAASGVAACPAEGASAAAACRSRSSPNLQSSILRMQQKRRAWWTCCSLRSLSSDMP
jgi:hypothetical protein